MVVDSSLEDDLLHVVGFKGGSTNRTAVAAVSSDDSSSDEDEEYVDQKAGSGRVNTGRTSGKNSAAAEKGKGRPAHDSDSESLSFGSDLYGDEGDRARLAAMSELDRELLLHERGEQRADHLRRKQVQRELKSRGAGRGKGSGGRAESSLATRSSSRNIWQSETGELDARQQAKAEKQQRQLHLDNMAKKKRDGKESARSRRETSRESASWSASGSVSGGGRSEEEEEEEYVSRGREIGRGGWDGDRSGDEEEEEEEEEYYDGKPEPEAEIEELQAIVLPRSKLAKWCWEPFFEEAAVGCLVRLGIGLNMAGQPVYRICEVASVDGKDTSKQYTFEGRLTHKYLDCKWGEHRARWQMARVSNKEPARHEYEEWLRELDRGGLPRLTKLEVKEKREQLRKVSNFVYSAADVKKMLEEKRQAAKRPRNVALEKDRLAKEMTIAEEKGDTDEVERLLREINSLDNWAETHMNQKDHKVRQLSKINTRNKIENFRVCSDTIKVVAKEGEVGYDPFSRRWTRSQNYYKAPRGASGGKAGRGDDIDPSHPIPSQEAGGQGRSDSDKNDLVQVNGDTAVVDTKDSLLVEHMFELPMSLEPLQRWGPPNEAFMARKRLQEELYGPQIGIVASKKMGTILTFNDYKRRQGLL